MKNQLARPKLFLVVITLVLLLLIGYPMVWVGISAFGLPETFSLRAFGKLFTDSSLLQPLINTVLLGIFCAVGAALLGVPLAVYTAITDGPLRRFVHLAVMATYITPPYLSAIAFTLLLSPQAGYLNQAFRSIGLPTFNVYSMAGLTIVVTLHVCSFSYLLVHDALKRIDAPLLEAARVLQASPLQVARRILLPLVAPAITSGVLMSGIIAMTEFGPQAVLGTPAGLSFLPTRIVSSLGSYPPRYADMAVLALVLVAFAIVGLYVQRRALGKQSFITVSGKGVRPIQIRLKGWRWPAAFLSLFFVLVATVLPLGMFASSAFAENWTTLVGPGNFTLDNFNIALLQDQITRSAVGNSAWLAVLAATICVIIALAIAYFVHRTRLTGRTVPDYIAAIPLGLPATVLGFGLLLAAAHPPFRFMYGTISLILVLYIIRFLPLASRTINSGASQLSVELEEAARISGATWWKTLKKITLPLMWPTMITAWLLVLMPAANELGGTVLLYSSGTETISIAILRLNDLGQFGPVAAMAVTVIAGLLLISALAQLLTRGRRSTRTRKKNTAGAA